MAEEKKNAKAEMPEAERHKLLDAIDSELRGAHKEQNFELLGRTYRLKTLDPAEESWADSYVAGNNFYQTARNRRAPYVAAALVSIDNIPVDQLWKMPEDAPALHKKLYDENKEFHKNWLHEQILSWLINPAKHGPIVQFLWACYLDLDTERSDALEELDPLLKKTRTGGSSSTSSLEKESSSLTPASGE